MSDLLAFWNEAPLDAVPFVHPRDVIPTARIQSNVSTYPDFLAAFKRGGLSRSAFHLSLLPQPYHGDLENAEILILLINPGLSACDYHVETGYPSFRRELLTSIRQEQKRHMFLDPKWAWTSGFMWWERKLRDIARVIASECFDGHYGRALADLACRIASIELVPYHSFNFGGFTNLASTEAARRFVASLDPSRKVIVTRSAAQWDLPTAAHIIKYPTAHARSASLGRTSMGGRAILECYGIRDC